MKKSYKILVTILVLLANLCSSMLWLTRDVTLQSQSAYWNQDNVIWYIGMHGFITMSFFFLNALFKGRWLYGIVAFSSIFTLMFDLGLSTGLHNISTALLFGTATTSIILYGLKAFRTLYIVLCSIAGAAFLSGLLGWLGASGIFLGEWIAEICVSICVIVEIWNYRKTNG